MTEQRTRDPRGTRADPERPRARAAPAHLAAAPVLADGARVVFVASGGMYAQSLAVDDPEFREGEFSGVTAYARAKRMQVVLAERWAEELADSGVGVHVMHPGWADTPGIRVEPARASGCSRGPILRTPEEGADTIVWLLAEPVARPGDGRLLDGPGPAADPLPGPAPGERADRERFWEYCRPGRRAVRRGAGLSPYRPPAGGGWAFVVPLPDRSDWRQATTGGRMSKPPISETIKAKLEQYEVERHVSEFAAQAEQLLEQGKARAGELAREHRDDLDRLLDRAADAVDRRTDGTARRPDRSGASPDRPRRRAPRRAGPGRPVSRMLARSSDRGRRRRTPPRPRRRGRPAPRRRRRLAAGAAAHGHRGRRRRAAEVGARVRRRTARGNTRHDRGRGLQDRPHHRRARRRRRFRDQRRRLRHDAGRAAAQRRRVLRAGHPDGRVHRGAARATTSTTRWCARPCC